MTTPWQPPTLRDGPTEVVITPQQANVLSGYCSGDSDSEIAARFHVSDQTIREHGRRLRAKLGARNRSHAVALVLTGAAIVTVQPMPAPGVSVLARPWQRST